MKPTSLELAWAQLVRHAARLGLVCRPRPGFTAVDWDTLIGPLAAATEDSEQALRLLRRLVDRRPKPLLDWLVLPKHLWTTIPPAISAEVLDTYLVPYASPDLRCLGCSANFPVVFEDDGDYDPDPDTSPELPSCPACGGRRTVRDHIAALLTREKSEPAIGGVPGAYAVPPPVRRPVASTESPIC
jgi:hypothetical protein